MSKNESEIPIEVELSKELGLKDALGIAVGALIGGGVFSVLGIVIYRTGPSGILSFVLAGMVSMFTAYSYVHLALKYPRAGGAFVYALEAFKSRPLAGLLGILLWFGYNFSLCLYAMTFGRYLGEIWPIFGTYHVPLFHVTISVLIFEIFSISIFIVVNLLGVKESSRMQNLLVILKVTILVIFVVGGLTAVQQINYQPFFPKGFLPVFSSSVLIFVSMEGFEILSNSVEEMKNPQRDLPTGMFLSIFIVLTLYVSVAAVTVGVLGYGDFLETIDETILSHAAKIFYGTFGVILMSFAAIISAASAINATLLGSSRLSYMLSHEKIIPEGIAKINPKTRVPSRSIIATGVVSLIFLITPIELVATFASFVFMIVFAVVNLSAIILVEDKKKKIVSLIGVILIVAYIIFWIFTQISQ